MNVCEAKSIAARWVAGEAREVPGFAGAFFHGSVNWLPHDADLPDTSDVDVMVVLNGADPPQRRGKFRYHGALLEASYLPAERVASADAVLADYHLAGSFRVPSVILDPSGRLTALQTAVAAGYAERPWVKRRCEHARDHALNALLAAGPGAAPHDRVTAWLFGTGITTHILLVAGLRNPTVRTRYLAVRELLDDYGLRPFHDELLRCLGAEALTAERATGHMEAVAAAFHAASAALRSPYPYAADISEAGRPVAIDGSREMIRRGDCREAVFWMLATYCRCMSVLSRDASPAVHDEHARGFWNLLAELGISSVDDLGPRSERTRTFIPRVDAVAREIMNANPGIR